ncbi:cytochrome P450 [Leptodontidium sp. MPI-SDFR-AT-0119]|nr:cytochrome P450 [Leptodontidium sp. MPI-SDFR-AT-0119]
MRNKAQHSARRKMQSTPYSLQAITESSSLVSEKADVLVRRMKTAALSNPHGQVDAYHLCGLFSFEVICKIGFGKDFGDNADGESSKLLKSMDESAKVLPLMVIFPFLKTWGIGKYFPGFVGSVFGSFEYWQLKTRDLVRSFKQQSLQGFMFSPLVTNVDQFLGRQLTEDEQVEEALGLMFAGSGTTSSTLTYMLFALSLPESQEYQARLREELTQTPDNYEDVKDLPFLNAVIKETMRFYPTIISTLPRVLTTELLVSNHVLPQGTRVGMQNYVHHRDAAVFPQPEKFIPDRWINATKEMEATLTPFSLGPRNCMGQNLARAELYAATNKVFRQLEVRLDSTMTREDMHMEDRFNVAPRSRKLLVQIKVLD